MKLLVIGGGITGLAAAWEAIRSTEHGPVQVVIAEASERWGGKLRTEHSDGLLIEHGPDSFVAYRPAALKLIDELGLADQVISVSGTRTVFLRSRGRLHPLPAGMGMVLPTRLWPFVTTGILSWADKLRAGLDLLLPRQLHDDTDVTIGAFLRARLGNGIVQRFADPMIGGIYGASVNELSLDAVLPSLRADESAHRSLMLASLSAGRKARASGPRGANSPFRTLRDGLGSMIDALVAQLTAAGADLQLNRAVDAVSATAGGFTEARFADGTTETFDAVIFAAGARATAALLAETAPAAAAALSDIPLATSTVLALAYPATAFATPVTTHGWLEADPAPISGITVSSAKWAGRAPDDLVLIRAFVPGRLGPIAEADDDELIAAVSSHIGAVLGATTPPTQVRVARWPQVMPKYTVGHLDRVATVDAALAAIPQWRVAGSPLRGVGVPDCVADGRRQATLALAAASDTVDHGVGDHRVHKQGSRR